MKRDLVELSQADRGFILKTLKSDTDFLRSLGIMDYSLLLAIEDRQEEFDESIHIGSFVDR